MPVAVRSLVDATMNCEDLAMNFLVAKITGKPSIKTFQFEDPSEGARIPDKPVLVAKEPNAFVGVYSEQRTAKVDSALDRATMLTEVLALVLS